MRKSTKNRISRRTFLARTAALCFSAPTLASLLAACGGSETAKEGGQGEASRGSGGQQGSWETGAPMPTARSEVAVAEAGGRIYVLGGFVSNGQSTSLNQAYDPATDEWQTLAPLPTARSGTATAALDGLVLVFGAEEGAGTFEQNEAYDPATESWPALTPLPTARHGIGAAVFDGAVYVPGGPVTGGSQQSDTNEAFTLS